MAAPAASSPALVILLPLDNLCIDVSISLSVFLAALIEYIALVLELIDGMFKSPCNAGNVQSLCQLYQHSLKNNKDKKTLYISVC